MRALIIVISLLAAAAGDRSKAAPNMSSEVVAGREVARQHCAACHSLGSGPSPMAEAPAFATIQNRYPPGGLDTLLQNEVFASMSADGKWKPHVHAKMPMTFLGSGDARALTTFLRSLER